MRRRSERKKTDDMSPVATSRRSSRRTTRRTPDVEKNEDSEQQLDEATNRTDSSPNRASSEERVDNKRRGRSTRIPRTPAKRRLRSISSAEKKIDIITEEENGLVSTIEEKEEPEVYNKMLVNINEIEQEPPLHAEDVSEIDDAKRTIAQADVIEKQTEAAQAIMQDDEEAEERIVSTTTIIDVQVEQEQDNENESVVTTSACEPKSDINEEQNITEVLITGIADEAEGCRLDVAEDKDVDQKQPEVETTGEEETAKPNEAMSESQNVDKLREELLAQQLEKKDLLASATNIKMKQKFKETLQNADTTPNGNCVQQAVLEDKQENNKNNDIETQQSVKLQNNEQIRTRKRKWLSKKTAESKEPILSISTDSLKNLIDDVQPVPLSDVQLESSSEVEEVPSERDTREVSSSPPSEPERRRNSMECIEKMKLTEHAALTVRVPPAALPIQSSPSPPRNQTSNVLYITNLVRPFTVVQLKGLLARTGKITENGFWIDRIKSKCYVQYETEDEAIETRHALHGVRWPVSNPKCLNVDFGKLADMERAIQTTNDDAPKYGQESKENFNSGSGWNREQTDGEDRKSNKPIREWDVGKKESREKREPEKQRSPKDVAEKEDKYKKNRVRQRDDRKSNSLSPVRKVKKEEPPLRLLDDLFRKTKAAPCIYWLPLTPEQITEKEAFRQKRIEERKERIKQRELEREKQLELERERKRDHSRDRDNSRERERSRDRSRERRRNRSSDRRRSRSRDRRRY